MNINNLIAIKILKMLVLPFEETEAFKLGVIDGQGDLLLPVYTLSSYQKGAYTYLDRFVFNIKKILNKYGKGSTITNYAAAYYLIKENNNLNLNNIGVIESKFLEIIDSRVILFEESIIVENYLKNKNA